MRKPSLPILLGLIPLLAAACQQGGSSKSAAGEVKLAIDHHMSGFGGLIQFKEGFPIKEDTRYTDFGTLHFKDTGKYNVTRPGQQTSDDDTYFLEKDGDLTIIVSQPNRTALRWPGFYDLTGDGYFFLSRDPDFLRLYLGVRQIGGTPDLAGDWHVFGDTLVFASPQDKPAPERVGRGFGGSITLDKDGKVTAGSWKDSSDSNVLVAGEIKTANLGYTDATLTLTGGPATGVRSFSGGIAKHLGILVDKVASDGSVGLFFMVRKQGATADAKRIVGKWRVAVHAVFNAPTRSGVDVANGVLTLESPNRWIVELNAGKTKYEGTYVLGPAGDITLTEKNYNQDWVGAFDADYRNIVFADRTVESSSNPWVGVFLGVKE